MKIIIDIPEKWEAKCSWLSDRDIMDYLYGIVRNGTPIPDNATNTVDVLEQIRDEIEQARFIDKNTRICKNALASGLEAALKIIDKYR